MTKTSVNQSELVNVGAKIDQLSMYKIDQLSIYIDQLSIYKRLGFIVRMALKNDFCLFQSSPLQNMKRKRPVILENHL